MSRLFLSDAARFRRTAAGLCLCLGPLALLVSNLLQTRGAPDHDALLDAIAERAAANEISFGLAVAGFTLMVPAAMGLLHLLRHRSVALGHLGGGLLIAGYVSFSFVAGTEALLFIAGADPALDRAALLAMNDRLGLSVVYNLINLTEVFGLLLGTLLLALALLRSRTGPRLMPLLMAAGILTRFGLAGSYAGIVLSDTLSLAGFAGLGLWVLRQTDSEWAGSVLISL